MTRTVIAVVFVLVGAMVVLPVIVPEHIAMWGPLIILGVPVIAATAFTVGGKLAAAWRNARCTAGGHRLCSLGQTDAPEKTIDRS